MILILGGTTEGRKAVQVVESAGKPYYYSTVGNEQAIEAVHAIRLTGGMDEEEMAQFCREKKISLLVDAAHPFAMNNNCIFQIYTYRMYHCKGFLPSPDSGRPVGKAIPRT